MFRATYFVQECPVCGRRVQVNVEHLGKSVTCQHCAGRFMATDPSTSAPVAPNPEWTIMSRVAELLAMSEPPHSRWHAH